MIGRSPGTEAAESLRQRHGLGSGYVDIFGVLRQLDIEVYQHSFREDSLEGAQTVRDGVPFIFVNLCHALTRQRLTAAHELGHYLLGTRHEGSGVFESNTEGMGGEEGEREAFSFARYFLMDEQGLRGLVSSFADERRRVAAAAGTYVVSVNVAAIHLAELGLIRAATKRALLEDLRSKQITPSGFLRTHGYRLPWTPEEPEPVLDPQHVGRALQAYRNGWLTLIALADSLQLDIGAAVDLLTETGIPLDEDDVAIATHSARP